MWIEVIHRRISRVGVKGDRRNIDHRSAKTLIRMGAAREVDGPHQPDATAAPSKNCQGTKADGDPCGANAMGETGYCYAHQSQRPGYKRRDMQAESNTAAKAENNG